MTDISLKPSLKKLATEVDEHIYDGADNSTSNDESHRYANLQPLVSYYGYLCMNVKLINFLILIF